MSDSGPFSNLLVVDFSMCISGPLATVLLAECILLRFFFGGCDASEQHHGTADQRDVAHGPSSGSAHRQSVSPSHSVRPTTPLSVRRAMSSSE